MKSGTKITDEEIHSYLSRIYFRYETKTGDKNYQLKQTYLNIVQIFFILTQVKCPDIGYEYNKKSGRPVAFTISPPIRLEKYFQIIEVEKERLKAFN